MQRNGFSTIELLVAVLILSMLAAFALPSLEQQVRKQKTRTFALELLHDIQYARTLSVSLNQRVAIIPLQQWSNGWEVFIDADHNAERTDGERLLVSRTGTTGVRTISGKPITSYIGFTGSGKSVQKNGGFLAGQIAICNEQGSIGHKIILNIGGRPRLDPIDAGDCPTQS